MKSIRYTSSPLLAAKTPVWRSRLVVMGLALGFLILFGRAAYVQVFDSAFFRHQGDVRFVRTLEIPASRGEILDRNGLLLASSVEAPSIWAAPNDLNATPAQMQQLATLLNMQSAELQEKVANREKSFVWIKRQVDLDVARKIAALKIPGVHQQRAYKREYPEGRAVAQVVGFAGVDGHGQEGVELSFDKLLAGHPGSRRVVKDRMGRVVEEIGREVPPVDGQNLQLSIDSKVQFFTFQRLEEAVEQHHAKSGSAVVLDAHTGEILALANYPSYIPGDDADRKGADLRNIAVTDTFEPGSTMKPITIAIALDAGKVTPDTLIHTAPGSFQLGRFTIRDTHDYGTLTVAGVIQKSSNIGAMKISDRLTAQSMGETYAVLGYGRKPDVPFPGAASGIVRPWRTWKPVEKATMAYGYGLSASLLQMAHSYTVFANNGVVLPLSLLRRPPGTPVEGTRVFTDETAREIRQMLHMVTEPGGTATQARTIGYSVGGKTGTARKQSNGGYSTRKYRAWFVGMAPIDHPRIIVGVMVDEPKDTIYGGTVAAPVFSEVVQRTLRILGVPPDQEVKPEIVAGDPAKAAS